MNAAELLKAADDLERVARTLRHQSGPGWLSDAMALEKVAAEHRAAAKALQEAKP